MNGCIVFFGESFRLGTRHAQNIDQETSYKEQMRASNSHMSFIKGLNSKNVSIDAYISTYKTPFTNDLIKIYNTHLIGYDVYDNLIGQGNLIHNSIKKISVEKYDFILFMRIDLFLKSEFFEIFDQRWDKIMWPSICFKPYHKAGNHPRVNDMMIFFPKKYYSYLQHLYYDSTGHGQWKYFIEYTDLTYDCLDTMLNTYHDSDSAKDFNPLYIVVNRPERDIHINKGDIFDKSSF